MCDSASTRTYRLRPTTLLLIAVDWLLLAISAYKHVIWRDEAQAWLIARDSSSLSELFAQLRLEGHPPLWHIILFVLSRFTTNPTSMQWVNYCFAALTGFLVLTAEDLRLVFRIGTAFSYFFLFEYGTIARNYMVGVCLILASARLVFTRSKSHPLILALSLSLASLTSLPALVTAFAFVAVIVIEDFRDSRWCWTSYSKSSKVRLSPMAITVFGISMALSLIAIHPAPDSQYYFQPHPSVWYLSRSLGRDLLYAYFPLFRNVSNFWEQMLYQGRWSIVFGVLAFIFGSVLACLLRRFAARWFFVSGTLLLILQTGATVSFLRHIGWLFVILVVAIMLEFQPTVGTALRQPSLWLSRMLAIVFIVQVTTSVRSLAAAWTRPFSSSKEVAEYIQRQNLEKMPLISVPGYTGTAVLAYLNRKTYYSPDEQKQISFVSWSHAVAENRHVPSVAEMNAVKGASPIVLLLAQEPLSADQQRHLGISLKAHWGDAIDYFDVYYLYY